MNVKKLENPLWIPIFSLVLIPLILVLAVIAGKFGWRLPLIVLTPPLMILLMFHLYPHSLLVKMFVSTIIPILSLTVCVTSLYLDSRMSLTGLRVLLSGIVLLLLGAQFMKLIKCFMNAGHLIKGISVNGYLQERVISIHCNIFLVTVVFASWADLGILGFLAVTSVLLLLYLSLLLRIFNKKPFLFLWPYLSKLEKRFGEDFSSTIAPDVSLKDIYERLIKIFETEKAYLDPLVSEYEMAQRLLTNRTYLSRAVAANSNDVNFRHMLNRYRVEYSMELIKSNPTLTVGDLATMSGFNVVPTFTSSFRQVYGVTPAIWIKQYRKSLLEGDVQNKK